MVRDAADPELRARALVLAVTFEPAAAHVQRALDEVRLERGADLHEAA